MLFLGSFIGLPFFFKNISGVQLGKFYPVTGCKQEEFSHLDRSSLSGGKCVWEKTTLKSGLQVIVVFFNVPVKYLEIDIHLSEHICQPDSKRHRTMPTARAANRQTHHFFLRGDILSGQ